MQALMKARTPTIGQLVQDCADGKIGFDELCERVAAMGYKTTSLYEMVCAAERGCESHRGNPSPFCGSCTE